MQVIDHFSEIQSLIRSSIFVENVDVEYEVKSRSIGIVHGILGMIDGSTLQFMELVNIKRAKMIRMKYRFHLTNVNDEMVFRYDNAPHHPEIATYPHHKHVKGEKVPRRSKEVGLKDVLLEIEEMISR
ncbi:MAG: hypothetical protein C5S48_00080 [Candidatus Methanogaster sp.]|nr:MAG: hypothetical protein C5S48_00080 [ANME-2 cluster archaeon]